MIAKQESGEECPVNGSRPAAAVAQVSQLIEYIHPCMCTEAPLDSVLWGLPAHCGIAVSSLKRPMDIKKTQGKGANGFSCLAFLETEVTSEKPRRSLYG